MVEGMLSRPPAGSGPPCFAFASVSTPADTRDTRSTHTPTNKNMHGAAQRHVLFKTPAARGVVWHRGRGEREG